jgi:ATP-dependent protease ClpP protease subunit
MPDYRDRLRAHMRADRQPIKAEVPPAGGDAITATIRLYDPIDSWGEFWGVSAKEFATVLDGLPDTVKEIRLLINSPGGEVFDALAILNMLRTHPARVVAVVEGWAASCASFIACGCDEVVMARNSEMFVHNAWGLCVGDADDMAQMADELNHFSDNVASIYAAKAGGTVEEWRAVMATERWYSADEAVAAGLADRVDDATDPDTAATAKARFDRSIFNGRKPKSSAPSPSNRTPSVQEGGSSTMDLTEIRQALDLPDETSEDDVHDAILDKLTAPPPPAPDPVDPVVPEGHVVVPEARLVDLETAAATGVAAAKKLHEQERDTFLDSVAGKYLPTNRQAWSDEYDRNPETTRAHFDKAPVILPLDAIGAGGQGDLDTADADYRALYGDDKKEVSV